MIVVGLMRQLLGTVVWWVGGDGKGDGTTPRRVYELIIKILLKYFDSNDPVRSQFCTCHDSLAVVTCAKL